MQEDENTRTTSLARPPVAEPLGDAGRKGELDGGQAKSTPARNDSQAKRSDSGGESTKSQKAQKHKSTKLGLLIILIVVILTIGGLVGYNYWQGRQEIQTEEELSKFPISWEEINQDFENKEKKLKSDTIPPESYIERFKEPMNLSLAAIESGEPSQPDFKDLCEDYLNIASIHSILGEYEQSEEWYLKILEL